MGSGIRVIVRNERYRGIFWWNASEWAEMERRVVVVLGLRQIDDDAEVK